MSVIQVNAIVSVSGTETSVTVGDITYEAEQGCQSLSEAVGAGAKSILIDGVTCTGVAINGVTVIGVNGAMIAEGSVINASGTNVVSDMAFVGNTTGGIYLSSGSLNISGGSFLNNRAGNGGAIYNHRGTMTVTDVYFSGNSVGNAGGAIRNEWRMTIGGATFVGNIGNQGAAIYNGGTITIVDKLTLGASQTIRSEGTIYIKADSFISPSAEGVQCALVVDGVSSSWREDRGSAQWITDDGYELVTAYEGDLYVTDADADHIVANTTIVSVGGTAAVAAVGDTLYYGPQSASWNLSRNNTALVDFYYSGRGAVSYSADRTIVGSGDSGVRDSHQSGHGGALYFYKYTDVNYRIEGLKFIDNSSTRGGAVMLEGGTLAVVDCVFSGNTCNGLGGAIYRNDGILTVSGSTFTGNTSTSNGGAIMHDNAGASVTISDSLFTDNRTASSGGALYSRGGMVSGSTFRNNLGSGGAIYLATGSLEISDSIFSGNTSGSGGGAIAVGGGTLKVSGSTFSGNTSAGGAISTGGVVYIENCVFDGNRSSGASGALNSGKYYISGTTFRNNVASTHGGVIRLNSGGTIHLADVTVLNNSGTASFYIYGTSSAAAVYVEGLVTLGSGQSFRFDGNANDSRNQFQVVGSSFFTGHGVAKAVDASANFSNWFVDNTKGVISADSGHKIFVLADSNNNDMYVTSADAMVTTAHSLVAVNNNPFTAYATLEAAQTAGVENILLFDYTPSGDIAVGTNTALIGGGVSGIGGTITVSNDAALTLAGDFTLTETLTVSGGTAALNNFTLSVASALFSGTDAYTLISGMAVPAADDLSVTVDGEARALNEWFDVGDHQYRLAVADDALGVQRRAYDTVYAVLNGATEIVLDGQTITFAGREDVFTDIAAAQSCLASDGTLVIVGQTVTTVTPGETATIMVESEVNRSGDYDILTVEGQSSLSLRLVDSTMNGFTMIHGGSVTGDCSVELDNTTLTSTDGRWYVLGSEVGGDLKVTMRDMTLTNPGKSYDALYLLRHTTAESGVVGGTIYFTLDNSEVTGTIYSGQWGANEQYCSGIVYTITDSAIGGDVFGAGGGGDIWVGGDVAMSLTDSTVGGDFVGSRKNTVTGTISMTLAGATVGGAVRKQKAGETVVTSALTLTLTGGTSVIGGLSEVDNLVIDAGARADFTTAQDLSDVAITVDGSAYAGSEIVVATGVSAIGSYTVTGAAGLTLYTAGEKMVLAEVSNTMSDGQTETNFVGGTSNLITGGTVTAAFFGTRNASGSVRTVFTGGTVVNSMVAGALVQAKDAATAALDTVSVDIYDGVSLLGGPSNGGMNYVAGYAYGRTGWTELPKEANYTVQSAVLNLSGSSISGNLYAGAHARKYAYTGVAATTVNVTGGIVEKLYGGGWAERGARSDVGTATVSISGGSVGRLYAGGGNGSSGAATYTTTADLTISGGTVDYVFLGGKNNRCYVTDATLTITGTAQTLTRISGQNDCGVDNTTGTAALNVQTNVTLGYLDYVDRINIAEECTLNITELVLYDDISQELSVYLGTDGFDGTWDIFSATNARDIDTLAGAQFYLAGGSTSYTMGDTIEIAGGSYSLNKTQSGLGIALSKIG